MSWLKKLFPSKINTVSEEKKGVPEGLWTRCASCNAVLYRAELARSLDVCPKCQHHIRLPARARLEGFLDKTGRTEIADDVMPYDHLKFRDSKKYKDRLSAAQKKTGEKEAMVVFRGKVQGIGCVAAAFEFGFIGGSMGSAVGERFVRGVNAAIEFNVPFICFSASGGARMQEGIVSLMQMAKTSAVLAELAEKGLPFISVLTDPTMGGVSASLAMLGDVIIAEPKALIGFAGPRVIEQVVKEILPEGFQRSEFLLEHGAIDMIVPRDKIRATVARLFAKLTKQPAPMATDKNEGESANAE